LGAKINFDDGKINFAGKINFVGAKINFGGG